MASINSYRPKKKHGKLPDVKLNEIAKCTTKSLYCKFLITSSLYFVCKVTNEALCRQAMLEVKSKQKTNSYQIISYINVSWRETLWRGCEKFRISSFNFRDLILSLNSIQFLIFTLLP